MPRRGRISKRDVLPDPMYGSKLVTKLINNVMYDGKKGVAQKIVYDAFASIEAKVGQNPLEVFKEALENVMPVLEVKARRVGGSTYQVPMEVRAERRQTLGLRWLVAYSRNRGERTMADRLAAEIIDARSLVPFNYEKVIESVKKTGRIVIAGDACERNSFMRNLASNITELCFDYLDAPPVVVGAKNWITPAHELETAFFPQPEWIVDAIHQRILPLAGHVCTNSYSELNQIRDNKLGV